MFKVERTVNTVDCIVKSSLLEGEIQTDISIWQYSRHFCCVIYDPQFSDCIITASCYRSMYSVIMALRSQANSPLSGRSASHGSGVFCFDDLPELRISAEEDRVRENAHRLGGQSMQ